MKIPILIKMANESAARPTSKIRILIADNEAVLARNLTEFLCSKGFEAQSVTNGLDARRVSLEWRPHFVIYELMLNDLNALAFLKMSAADGTPGNSKQKVLVFSGHNNAQNIRECMRLGAADYISKPITHEALLQRLVLHMQPKQEVQEFREKIEDNVDNALFYMHLTDLTLRESLKAQDVRDTLHNLTALMSLSLKAVRVSVIRTDRETRKGFVIASSDRRDIGGLTIDLNKYPEINYVQSTEKALAVDNMMADPTLHFVAKISKQIHFNAMLVAPIRVHGQAWGVLSVRMPETKERLNEFEIRWNQLVAHVVALVISRDPELSA
jgi:DNA-binding response OmpR family regulator